MRVTKSIRFVRGLAAVTMAALVAFATVTLAAEDPALPPAENNLPIWAGKTFEIEDPVSWWKIILQVSPDGKEFSGNIELPDGSMECSGHIEPFGELSSSDCTTPAGMYPRTLYGSIYEMDVSTAGHSGGANFLNKELGIASASTKTAKTPKTEATASPVTLPPAPYKAPPVGLRIKYDDRIYRVTRTDGHLTVYRSITGDTLSYLSAYALFGEYAEDLYVYSPSGGIADYTIDSESKKKLRAFWPLKVGKKTRFSLEEGVSIKTWEDVWTIALNVSKAETITLNGKEYDTYVIDEEGRSDSGKAYVGRRWYDPAMGVIVKAERTWMKSFEVAGEFSSYSKAPHFAAGETDSYTLVRALFPKGAPAIAVASAPVASAKAPAVSAAEIARLERKAKEKRQAKEARQASA